MLRKPGKLWYTNRFIRVTKINNSTFGLFFWRLVFLRLGVRNSYVLALVFLRLGVRNFYFWGLLFLRLGVRFLTFGG